VTISINPKEGPKLAREKRKSYLYALGMGEDVDWSFLVGAKSDIDTVANAVGFNYRYLPDEDQYAHPAVIFFVSPKGKISRYLYGINYPGQQIKFALVDASEGRVGSTVDRIILSCFHYDETVGAYGPFAFGIMRLGGALTLFVLGSVLFVFWRRERRRARREAHEAHAASTA
jgi:protein SCO1/2